MEIYSHINSHLSEIERIMETELAKEDERIYGLLAPFIKRGGKRIRPALTLLSCGACNGQYSSVLDAAAIIELFHNFTLIHDDVEDNSQFRRGEPTLHVSYGIPIALNSGDALYTLLWKKLVSLNLSPSKLLKLERLYAESFKRVVDGQGVELSWICGNKFDVTEDEYLSMIAGKTSALIGLSCETGAIMGGANLSVRRLLRNYGELIGTAFQIQDDVLNLTGDFEKYKKEIGGDISEGKRTLMVVHCLSIASTDDKQKLISILSSHSKDPHDIDDAITLLRKYRSIEYAQACAAALVAKAKKKLTRIPDSRDKQALLAIGDYVVTRER